MYKEIIKLIEKESPKKYRSNYHHIWKYVLEILGQNGFNSAVEFANYRLGDHELSEENFNNIWWPNFHKAFRQVDVCLTVFEMKEKRIVKMLGSNVDSLIWYMIHENDLLYDVMKSYLIKNLK